jgi:hypothetical protein
LRWGRPDSAPPESTPAVPCPPGSAMPVGRPRKPWSSLKTRVECRVPPHEGSRHVCH